MYSCRTSRGRSFFEKLREYDTSTWTQMEVMVEGRSVSKSLIRATETARSREHACAGGLELTVATKNGRVALTELPRGGAEIINLVSYVWLDYRRPS